MSDRVSWPGRIDATRNSTTLHIDDSDGVAYVVLTTSFTKVILEPSIHRPILPLVRLRSLAFKHAGLHLVHAEEILPYLRQE